MNPNDSAELLGKAARYLSRHIAHQAGVKKFVNEMQSTRIDKLVVLQVDVVKRHLLRFSSITFHNLHAEVDLIQHRLGQLKTGKSELEAGPSKQPPRRPGTLSGEHLLAESDLQKDEMAFGKIAARDVHLIVLENRTDWLDVNDIRSVIDK